MPVNPIPDAYRGATPYLIVHDASAALDFYKKAFGAEETMRMPMPNGRIGHAEIKIGDARVMLADEFPDMGVISAKALGNSPVTLLLYVSDVDARFNRAIAAGAKTIRPVANQFYGDRAGTPGRPLRPQVDPRHTRRGRSPGRTPTPHAIRHQAARVEAGEIMNGQRKPDPRRLARPDAHEGPAGFAPGELDELLVVADAEIDRGDLLDGEEVFNELRRLAASAKDQGTAHHRDPPR